MLEEGQGEWGNERVMGNKGEGRQGRKRKGRRKEI